MTGRNAEFTTEDAEDAKIQSCAQPFDKRMSRGDKGQFFPRVLRGERVFSNAVQIHDPTRTWHLKIRSPKCLRSALGRNRRGAGMNT